MIHGQLDLLQQAISHKFVSVLDVGAGDLSASRFFTDHSKDVTATGFALDSYSNIADLDSIRLIPDVDMGNMSCFADNSFDAIWCSHVLEHVQNCGLALDECWRILKPGGWLFLSVPRHSETLVGGHINTGWNLGLLMYRLILAGFDVKDGAFINHCWNVTAFVQKTSRINLQLRHDAGDIEVLSALFPSGLAVHQGIYGDFMRCNWHWSSEVAHEAERRYRVAAIKMFIHTLMPPIVLRFYRTILHKS